MGKKSENYDLKPAELVLCILKRLVNAPFPVTKSKLVEEYHCTEQTVRRAMQTLKNCFPDELIIDGGTYTMKEESKNCYAKFIKPQSRLCDTWNSGEWSADFDKAAGIPSDRRREMLRFLRRKVFWTTVEAALSGYYMVGRQCVKLSDPASLYNGTHIYASEIHPSVSAERFKNWKVLVVEDDCLAVARRLVERGERPAVLNLTSEYEPGGSVDQGVNAREGHLFRSSNYFQSLYQFMDYGAMYNVSHAQGTGYPLDPNFGGVFSRGVTVFRGRAKAFDGDAVGSDGLAGGHPGEEGYPFLENPWKADFIAVAGIPNPQVVVDADGRERLLDSDAEITRNKIRTIFNIALDNGAEVLVLGALGCGTFNNPPEHIAMLFREVMQEPVFLKKFRIVAFAIKSDRTPDPLSGRETLAQVFSRVLRDL